MPDLPFQENPRLDRGDVLVGSTWWKASAYEVVGGTHIAPVEGAEIVEYDPLQAGSEEAPYAELLRLDSSDPQALRQWADRFGLLGILLHQAVEVFFWPRWEDKNLISGSSISGAAVWQRQYRVGQPVESVCFERMSEAVHPTDVPVDQEELQSAVGHGSWAHIRPPAVHYLHPFSGELERAELAEGYAHFFPRVPGVCEYAAHLWRVNHAWIDPAPPAAKSSVEELREELNRRVYPEPLSERFLREYGEPISLIRTYVAALRETVRFWGEAGQAVSVAELDAIERPMMERNARFPTPFTTSVRAVQPAAVPSEREGGGLRWRLGWESRSLYVSLNAMVLQDFALRGARARNCARCGQFFVTTQYNREYCSQQCRKAAQMARYRENERARRSKLQRLEKPE